MFRCGFCGNSTAPREKAARMVVERRAVVYPYREGANRPRPGDPQKRRLDDKGGKGREAVREALACRSCAAIVSGFVAAGRDA